MNKYKSLAIDTIIFSIGSIGQKLIQFFLVPIYTNYLSTEEYGISDLIFTISQFAVPFLYLVIYDSVLRFGISRYEKKENVLKCSLFIWVLGSIACLVLSPLLGLYKSISEWRWYLTIYVIIVGFNDILSNYLKACSKNKLYSAMSIVRTLILALFNILLICYFRMGVQGYVLAHIIGSLLTAIMMVLFSDVILSISVGRLDRQLLKRMVLYSTPLIVNNISWWAIHSCDKIMIESMIGANELGIYTVAIKIPALINVVTSIFQQAWGISTVKEIESNSDTSFYSKIFRIFSLFVLFCVLIINCIIRPFMSIYVGESFFIAWKFIPLLLIGSAFSAFSQYYTAIYAACKKSMNTMMTMAIGGGLNVVLNFVFIRFIGIWGAVIATVASFLLIAVLRMVDSRKYIDFHINRVRLTINIFIVFSQTIITTYYGNVLYSSVFVLLFLLYNFKEIGFFTRNIWAMLK